MSTNYAAKECFRLSGRHTIGTENAITPSPSGSIAKHFSTTEEGAAKYAQQAYGKFGDTSPYTIVRVEAPTSVIDQAPYLDRGVPTVTVQNELLPKLGVPKPIDHALIPR